jgi:DNA repair exonuclease SbcCD ATPase subunit
MDEIEENGQFKMRLGDDVENAEIPTSVNELRLEKISTRVTIISILIPVLIVIVLVIAYLDIKKRVLRTEDTGSMSVQNLSKDLESRFSSLSLRQAQLEEQLATLTEQNTQSTARIEVKLKELTDSLTTLSNTAASKKALQSSIADVDKKLNNIGTGLEEVQSRVTAATEQWRKNTEQWEADLNSLRTATASFEVNVDAANKKLGILERTMINKPAMDLALRLEALRIEQNLKSPLDLLQQQVKRLESQVKGLSARQPSTPATTQPLPTPGVQVPKTDVPAKIEEQSIPQ